MCLPVGSDSLYLFFLVSLFKIHPVVKQTKLSVHLYLLKNEMQLPGKRGNYWSHTSVSGLNVLLLLFNRIVQDCVLTENDPLPLCRCYTLVCALALSNLRTLKQNIKAKHKPKNSLTQKGQSDRKRLYTEKTVCPGPERKTGFKCTGNKTQVKQVR